MSSTKKRGGVSQNGQVVTLKRKKTGKWSENKLWRGGGGENGPKKDDVICERSLTGNMSYQMLFFQNLLSCHRPRIYILFSPTKVYNNHIPINLWNEFEKQSEQKLIHFSVLSFGKMEGKKHMHTSRM